MITCGTPSINLCSSVYQNTDFMLYVGLEYDYRDNEFYAMIRHVEDGDAVYTAFDIQKTVEDGKVKLLLRLTKAQTSLMSAQKAKFDLKMIDTSGVTRITTVVFEASVNIKSSITIC